MKLTLRITNFDRLADGGPLEYSVVDKGMEIGRSSHLDWTLPDADRFISGRHCEVRFENGQFALYDLSSNGTMLNGSTVRMQSPHYLCAGDKIIIGQYAIEADISVAGSDAFSTQGHVAQPMEDLWSLGNEAPPAIDRRQFIPPKQSGQRAVDFAHEHLDFGQIQQAAPERPPAPLPMPDQGSLRPHTPWVASEPTSDSWGGSQETGPPAALPAATPASQMPTGPNSDVNRASSVSNPQGSMPGSQLSGQEFVSIFAKAAGIDPTALSGFSGAELAEIAGRTTAQNTKELMWLLKARASAKRLAKSSERTMIGADDNNPMKFVPNEREAIEIMFGGKRSGYLGAEASFHQAFEDLKQHEIATLSAMQTALKKLLDEISPAAIEDKTGQGTFLSRKAKAWDSFVTWWSETMDKNDNGALDIFLAYFSEAYDEASKKD